MTDKENRDPNTKRKPRRVAVRLTRNLVLHYRKSAQAQRDTPHHWLTYSRQFGDKLKVEVRTKPVETIGVVVVALYTAFAGFQSCQMGKANRLNQQIVRSTVSASLSCSVGSSFSHHSKDEPLTGAFYVNCGNVGKVAAEKVSGTFTLTAKSFPDERVLHTESWTFGKEGTSILGNDGTVWAFYSPKYSPDKEIPYITDGREIVIGDVAISYSDETGQTITRRFCSVELNSTEVGGSPDSWMRCQFLTAIRDIRIDLKQKRKADDHR